MPIDLKNPIFQSPYTYVQAAGSDRADGSSEGIHLRWSFFRKLGNEHLPKGDLSGASGPYPSTSGFNKDKDFVNIYRVAYNREFSVVLDLGTAPTSLTETSGEKIWHYNNFVPVPSEPTNITNVRVHFRNIPLYNSIRAAVNPMTSPLDFIVAYNGILEVSTPGKLMFKGVFQVDIKDPANEATAEFGAEAVSLIHHNFDAPTDAEKYYVSCRKRMQRRDKDEIRTFLCENIAYFRMKGSNFYARKIKLSTYEDHILGENNVKDGKLTLIGQFSLSERTPDVMKRLENPSAYVVNKRWPKYNEPNLTSGAFTVNVENYQDKWNDSNGLRPAVITYLDLSATDPQAVAYLPSEDEDDSGATEVSYLDMLRMVSMDYHVARMLGLGHIDNLRKGAEPQVYVMEYVTRVSIEDVVPKQVTTHLFMTLPTSMTDYRLPPAPVLQPVSYGLSLSNATANPTQLTDENGYTPYADERFINLKRERFRFENSLEEFFASEEFCICHETQPIGYGIEYKLSSESTYRRPEINHDSEYNDLSGLPETIYVPELGKELVFNHQETEEGIHAYALYSINWFSRVSPLSNERLTDFTKFPKRNTLIPPLNFAAQLIQEESPLIFTTSAEQQQLSNLTSPDKTLVRATFDWNHIHNKTYQFADYAEFFFRENPPSSIRGKITTVIQLSGKRAEIHTQAFAITSTSPAQTVQPYIAPADVSKYIGSIFVADEKSFIIEDIPVSGNNPVFIIGQLRETAVTDVDNENLFTVSESFISPASGSVFILVENLAEPSNWDSKLRKRIYLEPFHTASKVEIKSSGTVANNKVYTLNSVSLSSGNTVLQIDGPIANASASPLGNLVYPKRLKVIATDSTNKIFTVAGVVTSEVAIGAIVTIQASNLIDGNYTVTAVTLSGSNTNIKVAESFAAVNYPFYLVFNKTVAITALNNTTQTITVAGNLTNEIIPLYRETEHYPDGSHKVFAIGGVLQKATITEFEDKDTNGNTIPGSRTGVYEIVFDSYQLPDHINENVEWYKGVVRISEDPAYLPTTLEPDRTTPQPKALQIWQIDRSGSTLKVVVADTTLQVDSNYDPVDGYVPIKTGAGIDTNLHPSYRTYLLADTSAGNNFESAVILPQTGEGNRQTFMAVRAVDINESPVLPSYITPPVVLLAQEIEEPLPPGVPTGPTYATRPDYYGKATYTFDMKVNTSGGRKPYMLVFYRANERKILDQLYKPTTVTSILSDLGQLESPDKDFFTDRWNDLVNLNLDSSGLFKEHVPGGYRFPIPDNNAYSIPRMDITTPAVYPFNGATTPGAQVSVVKDAIDGAFFPLTEQPVLYNQIDPGKQTSDRKPRLRNNNGQILLPTDPEFDPNPMAVTYTDAGESYVRFTDYGLDGASKNFYFYFGIEMSNQLKVSDRSPIAGPILLVNAYPAEEPTIRKTITRLSNELLEITTAVAFEINDYISSEGIKQIDIYRTSNASDSLSIRTMKLVKSVVVGDEVTDDFSDVSFPLYGDPLFYRIVALREIVNENDQTEYIPSKPSNVVLTNIVDNVNPEPPHLSYTSDPPTTSAPITLNNVTLSWEPTCYNGIYYLYVMTSSGNWQKIYEERSNDPVISVDLANTDLQDGSIVKQDEDGNTIYKRFRVQVENSSGLMNLTNDELTI
ncbi:hypothetical protein D3C87_83210 [compost metagenome]